MIRLLCDTVVWRPFLGGDEDRNAFISSRARLPGSWRPFLGGDEDRNTELP